MDVIEASITVAFLVVGTLGGLAAVLHMRGWLPKAYITRLRNVQVELASLVGVEVENALNRVASAQEAKYAEGIGAQVESAKMSMVRAVGVDRQTQAKVSAAISEAILGPALPVLRHFAPGLADALEENPQLVDVVIQNPLFKKYIEPRIAQFLGGQANATVDASGWTHPGGALEW